jgi:hypothetical protein
MMDAYLIGNVLGRLVMSFALVWLVMFLLFSHFNWKTAFGKSLKWYGLLSVSALFILGIVAGISQGTL